MGSYRGEEPAAWIWRVVGLARKAIAVRLAGIHLSFRSTVTVTGVVKGRATDCCLRSTRTTGAWCRVSPEFSPAVTVELRFFSVRAIHNSKASAEEEGFLGAETALGMPRDGCGGRVIWKVRVCGLELGTAVRSR